MKKFLSLVKTNAVRITAAAGSAALGLVASSAKAATLDADVQAVASTTQNYLKDQFTAALVYVIPAVLGLFVLFWIFKFVKRKMSGAAH